MSREVTSWRFEWLRSVERPIYMDGRPHPSPNAAHTWAGFSTGEWIGDTLRVRVTHLKEEYLRRNGVFHSDQIEVTQYLIRRGNYLTFVVVAYDPVYLTEPLIRSTEYQLAVNQQLPPYPCTVVTEIDRPKGVIPHYLPNTNKDVGWFANRYKIPLDVVMGGAANMYPEIRVEDPRVRWAASAPSPDMASPLARPRGASAPARRLPLPAWAAWPLARPAAARPAQHAHPGADAARARRRARSRCCRCAATSTCSSAPAATSPSRSASTARCWWTPAGPRWPTR